MRNDSKHAKASPPRPEPRRSAAGFTLIELIAAITVSGLVIATVATALSRISKTRDVARTRLDAVTRANAALDAIRRDLAATVRDGDLFYTRIILTNAEGFTRYGMFDRDEILVYNNRLRPLRRDEYQGEGGEYESQYRIEDDSMGSVLWLRRDAFPDENGEGGGIAIPSIEGVVGLKIEAYDGVMWVDDWDSDLYGLPWALRVTVTATGESPDNPSPEPARSLITLRTQVPLDRIVPPPPPPEDEEEAGAKADGAGEEATGDEAGAQLGPDGQPLPGGVGGGLGGVGGNGRRPNGGGAGLDAGGLDGGGRPGGGRPGGGVSGGTSMGGGGGMSRPSNPRPGRGRGSLGAGGGMSGSYSLSNRENR